MGFEYHAAEKCISDLIPDPTKQFKKILTPSLIGQYRILWGEKVVDIFGKDFYHPYIVHDKEVRENLWSLFDSEKLVARGIARKVSVAYDHEGYAMLVNVFAITKKDKRQNFIYLLGILNSVLSDFYHKVFFFLARIPEGSLRYPKPFWENFPIRLPKTPEEHALAQQITSCVEQIFARVKSEQCASRFPDEYIKEYRARGEEFDAHEIVFNANHKELVVDIEKSLNNEFVIKIKGAAPIAVDSEAKAEYVKAALTGRKVSKGEKITILIPRADSLAKEALAQWQKDVQEAQGIAALEDEINELVYRLYGLDENDKKVIEEFLGKF
jgi:hypothetical protein